MAPNCKVHNSPVPAVNIRRRAGIYFRIGGARKIKNDFEIELDQDVLSIAAEAANVENEPTNTFSRKEFNYSAFKRAFTLPDSVDTSKIKAKYIHGILRVELPKRERPCLNLQKELLLNKGLIICFVGNRLRKGRFFYFLTIQNCVNLSKAYDDEYTIFGLLLSFYFV